LGRDPIPTIAAALSGQAGLQQMSLCQDGRKSLIPENTGKAVTPASQWPNSRASLAFRLLSHRNDRQADNDPSDFFFFDLLLEKEAS
jgi:hypothetical protein